MIDVEFALQEKFFDVTIAQRIPKIPSYPHTMLPGAQWHHLKGKDSLIEDPQESEIHAVCTVGAECPEFLQQYPT